MNLWELPQVNVAYFASGSGSNLWALETFFRSEYTRVKGTVIISDKKGIGAEEKAKEFNIPFTSLSKNEFSSDSEYSLSLLSILETYQVHLLCLAGYLKLLPESIVEHYYPNIVNIHPALLPKFGGKGMYGLHVHEAVLQGKEIVSGPTVHFVTKIYDEGPNILQSQIPVLPTDSAQTLQKRVLAEEHRIYPLAIKLLTSQPWEIVSKTFKLHQLT